jgi:hypothetical protein
MSKYRNLAKKALNERKVVNNKKPLNENLLYEDSITERMHKDIEEELRNGKHSLAECDIFPEGDEMSAEMRLIKERFKEVVERCREAFDVDVIDNDEIIREQMPLVRQAQMMEEPHKKQLEELAVEMVLEEFDIPEGSIDMVAELRPNITREGTKGNDGPQEMDEDFVFEDADEIAQANAEVKKRRVLNAIIQGAAKNVNHMFHMKHDNLMGMNPRLPGTYKKMMSAADYMFFIMPDLNDKGVDGGRCDVGQISEGEESKPQIKAQAMVFPVLIHELVKGVMEVLSMHGQPTQENIAKYAMNKADFIQAEASDMRFSKIWSRFCESIPSDDFNLKHHAYADVAALPPNEFNVLMKEIIGKTKAGKRRMAEIIGEIKRELQEDEYNESMGDSHFGLDDLLG